jgi:hypothetical protein
MSAVDGTSGMAEAATSGIFAGIVAIVISVAIERLGHLGALLGGSPTTLIPFVYSFWNLSISSEFNSEQLINYQKGLLTTPFAMVLGGIWLHAFKILPNFYLRHIPHLGKYSNALLLLTVVSCYTLWGWMAWVVVSIFHELGSKPTTNLKPNAFYILTDPDQSPIFWMSMASVLLVLVYGLHACWSYEPKPIRSEKISIVSISLRGTAAFGIVFCSVLVSHYDKTVGAVLSNMPAIVSTVLVTKLILS